MTFKPNSSTPHFHSTKQTSPLFLTFVYSTKGKVKPLSRVQLFAIPRTAVHQPSMSITNSQSLIKFMSLESVMPSNHLLLCPSLLLLPSIFPSIRAFFNEWALCIRWPKYWSFSSSISPSNECSGLLFWKYILDEWTLYTNRTGMTG